MSIIPGLAVVRVIKRRRFHLVGQTVFFFFFFLFWEAGFIRSTSPAQSLRHRFSVFERGVAHRAFFVAFFWPHPNGLQSVIFFALEKGPNGRQGAPSFGGIHQGPFSNPGAADLCWPDNAQAIARVVVAPAAARRFFFFPPWRSKVSTSVAGFGTQKGRAVDGSGGWTWLSRACCDSAHPRRCRSGGW